MSIINGAVKSTDILAARKPISMEKFATKLDDSVAFFTKLTQRINGIQVTGNMKHSFRELRLRPSAVTLSADEAAAQTSLSVSNPGAFLADDAIYSPSTREIFYCNETIGGTAVATAVLVRNSTGSGGITNAIPSGAVLYNLAESHAEGEDIPAARAVKQTSEDVYLYQKDATLKHTDIQINEDDYGQKKLDEDREVEMIQYVKELNMVLYTGDNSYEDTSGDGRRWLPAGLEYYLYNSGFDASELAGGLTLAAFAEIIRPTKEHSASSEIKNALCGTNAWATISMYPATSVRVEPGKDKSWGVTVRRLITGFGDMDVSYDSCLSATNGMADRMFIIDAKHIQQLQLRGLPLIMKRNVNDASDIHNVVDVITGTRGMELKLIELHKEVFGI